MTHQGCLPYALKAPITIVSAKFPTLVASPEEKDKFNNNLPGWATIKSEPVS